jgi:hypothetical protein
MEKKNKKREHTYTQAERKKINKIKKVKLNVKTDIPNAKTERKRLIRDTYKTHPRIVFCPALNDNVAINKSVSSDKTRDAAADKKKSTQLALMAPELLKIATLVYDNTAKDNAGQDTFDNMFILIAAVKGIGYAKITIGRYKPETQNTTAPYCQYCVSHISLHTLKNK